MAPIHQHHVAAAVPPKIKDPGCHKQEQPDKGGPFVLLKESEQSNCQSTDEAEP